jgi:5-formyltetrahydrofolate cyclo-ligase
MTPDEKQRLRDRMRRLPAPPSRDAHSGTLSKLLLTGLWSRFASVLIYSPLPGEPDPAPLESASKGGRPRLVYPRIEGESLGLYSPLPRPRWLAGPFGLMEPDPGTWTACPLGELDCAVIPGLAFDVRGGRLGRGGGYYDRLLGDPLFRGIRIGITWEERIVGEIPRERHDVPVDLVVTESRILDPSRMLDKDPESL